MRKCVRCCLVIIIQNTTKMPDTFLAIRDRDSPRGFADRNRSGQRILELLDGLAVLCCCSNIIPNKVYTGILPSYARSNGFYLFFLRKCVQYTPSRYLRQVQYSSPYYAETTRRANAIGRAILIASPTEEYSRRNNT